MTQFCPICKRPLPQAPAGSDPTDLPHFPFCSERCKLIDLARWLDGKYQVPVVEDDLDESGGPDDEHLPRLR